MTLLDNASLTPTPIFYQHLTDGIFRELIKTHFVGSIDDSTPVITVTEHKAGTLCYATEYMCRHLRKKIEHESHEFKEELVLCLMVSVKSRKFLSEGLTALAGKKL